MILERGGARTFSDSQWLSHFHRGDNKPRFQCCVDSNNNLLHVRTIQCHPGGELMSPELLNQVAIPLRWKEYLYRVGSSFTVNSIQQAGLTGAKDTKEGRQTVFFTPIDPQGEETEEEYDDSTKPCKIHHKNRWNVSQDAICWVKNSNSGRPDLTPSSFVTQCWLTASKKVVCLQGHQWKTQFCTKGFLRHDQLRSYCRTMHGRCSTTIKQRAIVCGGKLLLHLHVQGVPQNA